MHILSIMEKKKKTCLLPFQALEGSGYRMESKTNVALSISKLRAAGGGQTNHFRKCAKKGRMGFFGSRKQKYQTKTWCIRKWALGARTRDRESPAQQQSDDHLSH